MGCDIHVAVEVWDKEGEEWKYMEPDGRWGFWAWDTEKEAKEIYSGRNYTLFGVLAGVRGESYDDLSQPRGYPDDASDHCLKDLEDVDLHSHSYFTLQQLLEWDVWENKGLKDELAHFYDDVVGPLMLLGDPDEVRILFCFDN